MTVFAGPSVRLAPGRRLESPLAFLLVLLLLLGTTGCVTYLSSRRWNYDYQPGYGVESPAFRRSLEAFGTKLVPGNSVRLLENGDGFFPEMLSAIRTAQTSINFEMYIFSDDQIGRQFAAALSERARAGVPVRLLVDDVGSRLGSLAETMREAGVRVEIYEPIHLILLHRLGRRTHRKILTVDGRIGFCGGAGVDQRWAGDARDPEEWRETMVRVEGPVVSQLQAIFLEDWLLTTGELIHGPNQFPAPEIAGERLAQAVSSSQWAGYSEAKLLFYMVFQAARERIWIENAYFVPERLIRRSLLEAVERGVDVKIIVPGRDADVPMVRMASHFHYGELLEGGVEIYEFTQTMNHNKVAVVDGIWSTVGTINFDQRSMWRNAEVSLAFYDREAAGEVEAMFERDLARSRRMTLEEWRDRGPLKRFAEAFSWAVTESF